MENKFKLGDKVVCINGNGWEFSLVTEGETYTITDTPHEGKHGKLWIDYANDYSDDFELVKEKVTPEYSTKHYDAYYYLTEKNIEEGKIRVDAYWVAKQWKIGSRDDSGALFHNLKTIARFGEKNSIEREIKALYNQTKALARVYGVELD